MDESSLFYELIDPLSSLRVEAEIKIISKATPISFLQVLNLTESHPLLKDLNEHRYSMRNGYIIKKDSNVFLKIFHKRQIDKKNIFIELKSRFPFKGSNGFFLSHKEKSIIPKEYFANKFLLKTDNLNTSALIKEYMDSENVKFINCFSFHTLKNILKARYGNRIYVLSVDYYRKKERNNVLSLPFNPFEPKIEVNGPYFSEIEIKYLGSIQKKESSSLNKKLLEIKSDLEEITNIFRGLGEIQIQTSAKV